jgi:hypothetical protein
MLLARVLMMMAVTVVLAACSDADAPGAGGGDGGGGGGSGGSSLPDPCSLVTRAEVETAAGGTVAEGVEQDGGPNHYAFGQGRLCTFVPDDGTVSTTTISVFNYAAEGWAQYKQNQATYSTYKEVTGVGEEAVSSYDNQIGLHQDGYVVDISVGLFTAHDPAGGPRVLALATAAAGRLGS